jgi:hypothetical protein
MTREQSRGRTRPSEVRQYRYETIIHGKPPDRRTLADVNGPVAKTTQEGER